MRGTSTIWNIPTVLVLVDKFSINCIKPWHGGFDLLSFTIIFKNRSIPSSVSVLFLLPPTTNSGSISFVASVDSGQVQCLAASFRIFLLADFLRRGLKKHGFCRHFVENMRVKKDGICFECRTYIIGGKKVKCCYNNDFPPQNLAY